MSLKPIFLVALGATSFATVAQTPAPTKATGNDFINVFETLSGKQAGVRKGHAKGVCATGEFEPSDQALHYSNSPLLRSGKSQANIRFSMAGGNPNADERARTPRGIGVQFITEKGEVHNIAGLTTPVFPGKSPEVFLGLLNTLVPNEQGKVDFKKVAEYRKQNPSTLGQFNWLQAHNPPSSYAHTTYFGIHTFYMVNDEGKHTPFRWQLVPETAQKQLTDEQMTSLESSFLAKQLEQDLAQAPIHLQLQAVIGQAGDPVNDPSVQWPADREVIALGRLTLTASGKNQCDPTNFDPNLLAPGFAPSDDAVLKLRSSAYAISFGKRLTGQ